MTDHVHAGESTIVPCDLAPSSGLTLKTSMWVADKIVKMRAIIERRNAQRIAKRAASTQDVE